MVINLDDNQVYLSMIVSCLVSGIRNPDFIRSLEEDEDEAGKH